VDFWGQAWKMEREGREREKENWRKRGKLPLEEIPGYTTAIADEYQSHVASLTVLTHEQSVLRTADVSEIQSASPDGDSNAADISEATKKHRKRRASLYTECQSQQCKRLVKSIKRSVVFLRSRCALPPALNSH